jgi:hypothetical protein
MLKREVEKILARRPFVPLTIYLDNGEVVDVPFSHVAVPLGSSLLVMQGVRAEGSRSATGKVEFEFDRVSRIEPRKPPVSRRRKKAS